MAEPTRLKILVAGPHQSGKSCLIKNYCEGRFVKKYLPTIGIDYGVRNVNVNGTDVKINFFDASGNDDFKDIRMPFYKDSQCVIFVADGSNPQELQRMQQFIDEAEAFNIQLKYLVISKIDIANKIPDDQVIALCKKYSMRQFRCSSATGENVENMFIQVFKDVHTNVFK